MLDDCTALILAGGESTRMGRDKTTLPYRGKSLLQHSVDQMQALFPDVLVSVRSPRADLQASQVCDETPGLGPLAGICAGLSGARTAWVFALAADMPFVDASLVRQLASERRDGAQAVVPVVGGFPQPLMAFYHRGGLPVWQDALSRSDRSLRSVLGRLSVRWVEESELRRTDRRLGSFVDIDTPEDLARLATRGGVDNG